MVSEPPIDLANSLMDESSSRLQCSLPSSSHVRRTSRVLYEASEDSQNLCMADSRVPTRARGEERLHVSHFFEASLETSEQVLARSEEGVCSKEYPPELVILGMIMGILD